MRKNGTKYPKIDKLPAKAIPVSEYAKDNNIQVGTVYMGFKRFRDGYITKAGNQGKASNPGYTIRCFKGMNFVIPNK
jgi:hypothetical protein